MECPTGREHLKSSRMSATTHRAQKIRAMEKRLENVVRKHEVQSERSDPPNVIVNSSHASHLTRMHGEIRNSTLAGNDVQRCSSNMSTHKPDDASRSGNKNTRTNVRHVHTQNHEVDTKNNSTTKWCSRRAMST